MIQTIVNFILDLVKDWWYNWIFIMMMVESSFIPFPSELAMIPAWYLVSIWEMNFVLALAYWTFWAIVWSTINYFIAFKLWEPLIKSFIHRYWKYIFVNVKHYDRAEKYFEDHWPITIFVSRFIPAIRQLISLPAWAFEMNYTKFFIYTWIWAMLWNIVLMIIWYLAWENQELIKTYSTEALIICAIFIFITIFVYYTLNKKRKK